MKSTITMTSSQIQKELSKKVTERMLLHEMKRFGYMTEKQLITRIYKITNPVKLEALRQWARTVGENKLAKLAQEKRDFMYN
jgi:hypothetical protein